MARQSTAFVELPMWALPKMLDDFSLFKRYKQDELLKHIPVVLYSPRSNDQKSERFAHEVGATPFVSNGLKADVIVKAVDEALRDSATAPTASRRGHKLFPSKLVDCVNRATNCKLNCDRLSRGCRRCNHNCNRPSMMRSNYAPQQTASAARLVIFSIRIRWPCGWSSLSTHGGFE